MAKAIKAIAIYCSKRAFFKFKSKKQNKTKNHGQTKPEFTDSRLLDKSFQNS